MSEGLTTQQLQNPAWESIYSQQLLMPQDLMEMNISKPNDQSVKDQVTNRTGTIDQKDWKYFSQNNEPRKNLKKRYPYLY